MPTSPSPEVTVPGASTVEAIGWVYLAFVVEKLSVFGTTVVLARVLAPDQFGLMVTALLVMALISIFRDCGISDALVFVDLHPGTTAETAFGLNLIIGAVLATFLFATAPYISAVLHESSDLTTILRAMSLTFFFNALGGTHSALLQRQLKFSRRATVDLSTAIGKAAITISLVVLGFGVWSVVIGFIAGSALRSALLWLALEWRPRPRLDIAQSKELLGFGKHILFNGLISQIVSNVDQVAIAVYFGKQVLADYYIGSRIPEVLLAYVCVVLTNVLFPTFASMKSDRSAVARHTVETIRYLCYLLFPVAVGLILVSDEIIAVAFGSKWQAAPSYLSVITLCILSYTVLWPIGDGLKAVGRPDVLSGLGVLLCIAAPLAILCGLAFFHQPIAACYSYLAALVCAAIARAVAAKRILGIGYSQLILATSPGAAASLGMILPVLATKSALAELSDVAVLAAMTLVGMAAYAAILWIIDGRRVATIVVPVLQKALRIPSRGIAPPAN